MMGEGGEVLFVEHPKRGWEIPEVYLESGETPEQALHRELKEETGLTGHLVRWNTTYPGGLGGPRDGRRGRPTGMDRIGRQRPCRSMVG